MNLPDLCRKASIGALMLATIFVVSECRGEPIFGPPLVPVDPTYRTTHSSVTVNKHATPDGKGWPKPDVRNTMQVFTRKDAGSQQFEWGLHTVFEDYSASGDDVSLYTQFIKHGEAHAFGAVLEVQDVNKQGGNIWGLEIDVMTGPRLPDSMRVGAGVVVGRGGHSGDTAVVDYGFWLVPWNQSHTEARVRYGMKIDTQCEEACIAIQGSEWMQWDDSGEIKSRFDEQSGFWGLYFRGKPVWQVQMETGEIRHMGRRIKVEYLD